MRSQLTPPPQAFKFANSSAKPHQCWGCLGVIVKGMPNMSTTYTYVHRDYYGNKTIVVREHLVCFELRRAIELSDAQVQVQA